MKLPRMTRRRFLAGAAVGVPCALVADAGWIEPEWLRVRHVRIGGGKPAHRLVHFTDLHHKGDRAYLQAVVRKINSLSPDLVCFTGDLIEDAGHLPEALELLGEIKSPMYGVPGNHDYWAGVPFEGIIRCFAGSGGAWMEDEERVTGDGKITVLGAACRSAKHPQLRPNPLTRNVLLIHYPAWVKKLGPEKHDLILAGHSHGGQVRLPFYGPIVVPFGVEEYDLGLFQTAAGPLYVNPGIGWFWVPIRFRCRPEITVFEI
jgi:uncharacterized protein